MVWNKLKTFAELVKIEHTLFSLPFSYTAGILAARDIPNLRQLVLITLCVTGARSAAMAWNRLADRCIDARNPRTANRALPENRLSTAEVVIWVILSLGLLAVASWMLNPICIVLIPIAVLITFFYSYTKRFTWLCHFVLGVCLGLAPIGSWIGMKGDLAWEPILVGLGVVFWTAGFDIIYATLDYEFDLKEKLHSIPVRFGLGRALNISLGLHCIAFLLFVILKFTAQLGGYYLVALCLVGFLLYWENAIISPEDLSRVNLAFFQINSLVSIVILFFTILEFGV